MKKCKLRILESSEDPSPDKIGLDFLRSALLEVAQAAKLVDRTGRIDELDLEDRIDWDGLESEQRHWDSKLGLSGHFLSGEPTFGTLVNTRLLERDFIEDVEFFGGSPNGDWSGLEIENYVETANAALDQNEIDQFVECYDALIQYVGAFSWSLEGDPLVDTWAMLATRAPKKDLTESNTDKIHSAVIKAVGELSKKLAELIAEDRKALMHIEWRQLEIVIATCLEGLGYQVELTPSSKDGGKDIVASCHLRGRKRTYYIEVKHWRSGKKVGDQVVFDFIQVNLSANTSGGVILSSSGFNGAAYSILLELEPVRIQIKGTETISYLCKQFAQMKSGLWQPASELNRVLFGD
ncbi:restriction endonuclease [uncultured Roseobacter sp.]|uniref:restriction endonuclease n=1 Tax=uncultured Roseobacter sp. TaxID=114847 RepID=UPI00261D2E89|nr:restriction endonuclease [uncultured Roseobacter sp.]